MMHAAVVMHATVMTMMVHATATTTVHDDYARARVTTSHTARHHHVHHHHVHHHHAHHHAAGTHALPWWRVLVAVTVLRVGIWLLNNSHSSCCGTWHTSSSTNDGLWEVLTSKVD